MEVGVSVGRRGESSGQMIKWAGAWVGGWVDGWMGAWVGAWACGRLGLRMNFKMSIAQLYVAY